MKKEWKEKRRRIEEGGKIDVYIELFFFINKSLFPRFF